MGKKKGKKGSGKKKKKGGGGDAPEVDEATAGMTRDQLIGQVLKLKDELDREREERNYFQLERDKINTFWEISKRQLDECRAEMRNKDREIEEVEEQHTVEIKVYKQKVKHLLYEHTNQIAELKLDATVQQRLAKDEHAANEKLLRDDKRSLKVELKEMELENQKIVKDLQLGYEQQSTKLREDLQRTARELQQKYERKMEMLREDLELRRKNEIKEIEERKNKQIHTLMRNHEKAFGDIKNYYNDITLNNMALINNLKEQVEAMKKKEADNQILMDKIRAENLQLTVPLREAREKVADLGKQLANYEKDKASLAGAKARLKVQEAKIGSMSWEQEVLEQRFTQMQSERDDLHSRFNKTIYEVQQKTGLKNLLLEKKLGSLLEQLEKKEAQLNEVLAASNLDPTALAVVTRKLEDVLDAKNAAIKDLQYELARACKAHNDVIRAYESKLREFGIPVEELGFRPVAVNPGQPLGQGPAGLVAARS